ncbi:hypothetical protein ACIQAC_15485 [Streptomyces sp. NPDC088387]|uniref:hypothetical protein n=1 Tax=Streptomyces sp. NPDC088387 TaxID=3365859 RepID=UPI00381C7AED
MRTRTNTADDEAAVRALLGPADPADNDTAPDPTVLAGILATEAPDPVRRYRRRWVIGAAAVGVLGAGGLAAQATGIIPDDVGWGLDRAGHGPGAEGMEAITDKARKLFSGRAPDGTGLEMWTAPNPSGGTCDYLRALDRDGRPDQQLGGWSSCGRGSGWGIRPSPWGVVDTQALTGWTTLYGRAPAGAVTVRYVWDDGRTEQGIHVGRDRYFLHFLRWDSRTDVEWTVQYSTEFLAADGKVLAARHSNR